MVRGEDLRKIIGEGVLFCGTSSPAAYFLEEKNAW